MGDPHSFPALTDWDDTRQTLHAYAKVLGAIRGAFTPEQRNYWHISLRPYTAGLTTTPIPYPKDEQRSFALSLDLRNHYVLLSTSEGEVEQTRIVEGLSATQLGDKLLGRLAELGVKGEVPRAKFDDENSRPYAMKAAERYFTALSHVARIFEAFKAKLGGESSPVQLWPHHFDISFELFGDKMVKSGEGESQSQIGFGFAPRDSTQPEEYFYVNPFPFEEGVARKPLPNASVWFTESWKGAVLPYSAIAEQDDGEETLQEFLQAAYKAEKGLITN